MSERGWLPHRLSVNNQKKIELIKNGQCEFLSTPSNSVG